MEAKRHAPTSDALLADKTFPGTPEAVRLARCWAKEVFSLAGAEWADVCELLVSEVATNAIAHTDSPWFRVRILSSFHVEIWDASYELPQRRQTTPESEGGRGLELLDLLSPDYQVVLCGQGKKVCFQPQGWIEP
ncbi:ATP-binding protein [Streptomyces sp. ISL-96]|uniref:ATP-binding protein n=1 Tax=Streptomyces sp. ISL-96 TaxID=2819191 RepID=UPI002553F263|nr:ATP-binding protein [Streptomyces sp. ISL-96]